MPRRGGGGHGGGGRRAPTCREQSCRWVPGGRGSASPPPPLMPGTHEGWPARHGASWWRSCNYRAASSGGWVREEGAAADSAPSGLAVGAPWEMLCCVLGAGHAGDSGVSVGLCVA